MVVPWVRQAMARSPTAGSAFATDRPSFLRPAVMSSCSRAESTDITSSMRCACSMNMRLINVVPFDVNTAYLARRSVLHSCRSTSPFSARRSIVYVTPPLDSRSFSCTSPRRSGPLCSRASRMPNSVIVSSSRSACHSRCERTAFIALDITMNSFSALSLLGVPFTAGVICLGTKISQCRDNARATYRREALPRPYRATASGPPSTPLRSRGGKAATRRVDPGPLILRVFQWQRLLGHAQRTERVHHHGQFVRELRADGRLCPARVRTVRNAVRMVRDAAELDALPAHELAGRVVQYFVRVHVAVVVRRRH